MSSLRQIDANRRNAQNSTGPRTPEGKQASSRNALRSGIHSLAEVLPGESPEELAALVAEHHTHHNPQTPQARDLVDSLVRNAWLLRRFARLEAAFFACDCDHCRKLYSEASTDTQCSGRYAFEHRKFQVIQQRINATERNYHRTLKALENLPPLAEPQSKNEANSPEPDPTPRTGPAHHRPTHRQGGAGFNLRRASARQLSTQHSALGNSSGAAAGRLPGFRRPAESSAGARRRPVLAYP